MIVRTLLLRREVKNQPSNSKYWGCWCGPWKSYLQQSMWVPIQFGRWRTSMLMMSIRWRLESMWEMLLEDTRNRQVERGFEIIDIFIGSKFFTLIHLEVQDIGIQYHWLHLGLIGVSYSYLTGCYFASLFMQIYSTSSSNWSQSFYRLIEDVLKYQNKVEFFLVGNFNAYICYIQFTQSSLYLSFTSFEKNEDSLWSKIPYDTFANDLT